MKILFVVPYPTGGAPSQRFRFEHYYPLLMEKGIHYKVAPFWPASAWEILYSPGKKMAKVLGLAKGFLNRILLLFQLPFFNFIYIHREATPVGPAWFEWLARFIFRKKIIYDFDDAIWIPAVSDNNKAALRFRNFKKTGQICKWSYKVSVGNSFLGDYARKFNKNIAWMPTVVNTEARHNQVQDQHTTSPNLGWTGTFSTLKFLDELIDVLKELELEFNNEFIVIADKDPGLPLKNYRFIPWNRETEIADLLQFHIGIMPLTDDDLSRGKCGFKAIQYMSLGIPAVVSSVGANREIVTDGESGFVCTTREEWKEKLSLLLSDHKLRMSMGQSARERIINRYSVSSTKQDFLELFK
jgi:glycosyltransferase involved in cell wall biosynthesis